MSQKDRNLAVKVTEKELTLLCEWADCEDVFNSMTAITEHLNTHLTQYFNQIGDQSLTGQEGHQCQWRECSTQVEGEPTCFLRHVYFHLFHIKIKCVGKLLLEKTGRQQCLFDTQSRNMLPELPESFLCGWEECHVRFENADLYYRHVESHTDCFPSGNSVKGGCKCAWQGCTTVTKSRHKLKDHVKSHTQEKVVACHTCGALFASRTKFFDHLTRQAGYTTGQQYQCSHCNSTFGTERLLRDHMRYHVNQYKCPYCDMTCPSPSNMQLHIRYRHSDDKPFKCPECEYRAKSVADLRSHQTVHETREEIRCQVPDCDFTTDKFRSYQKHFRQHHESGPSDYECHVCGASFSRGALLSKHLKNKHKFNWPSGHSRFRYKRHLDGKWRLQTVRYESIELQTHEEPVSSAVTSSSQTQVTQSVSDKLHHMPYLAASSTEVSGMQPSVQVDNQGGSRRSIQVVTVQQRSECDDFVETETGSELDDDYGDDYDDYGEEVEESIDESIDFDFNNSQNDISIQYGPNDTIDEKTNDDSKENNGQNDFYIQESHDGNNIDIVLYNTGNSNNNAVEAETQGGKSVVNKKRKRNKYEQQGEDNSKPCQGVIQSAKKKIIGKSHANKIEPESDESEEAIEITIMTNNKGEYVIQSQGRCYSPVAGSVGVCLGAEETMYNLQMLGDVALQKHNQN